MFVCLTQQSSGIYTFEYPGNERTIGRISKKKLTGSERYTWRKIHTSSSTIFRVHAGIPAKKDGNFFTRGTPFQNDVPNGCPPGKLLVRNLRVKVPTWDKGFSKVLVCGIPGTKLTWQSKRCFCNLKTSQFFGDGMGYENIWDTMLSGIWELLGYVANNMKWFGLEIG